MLRQVKRSTPSETEGLPPTAIPKHEADLLGSVFLQGVVQDVEGVKQVYLDLQEINPYPYEQ